MDLHCSTFFCFLLSFQIASHSKSSTKSRFWNRSFHILSCDHSMKSSDNRAPSCEANAPVAVNGAMRRSRRRLDRKLEGALEPFGWSRCNWRQNLLVTVIIVLLNSTTIICQPRQEGEFTLAVHVCTSLCSSYRSRQKVELSSFA